MEPSNAIAVVLVVLFVIFFVLACTCYQFAVRDVGRLESQRAHRTGGRSADTRSDALPTEHREESAAEAGPVSDTVAA